MAYTYQGQRAGRPHVASWAETEIPLAADLLAGDQDPRSPVAGLLGRALAALPQAIRDGAAAAGRKIALRADAGYFAGQLARAAAAENMAFAIGAKRITSMWKALAGIAEDAWRDAIDMPDAQVAVSPYKPADWPEDTVLLVRRVKLDPDQVSAGPRSRRRRTLHPDQRALPIPELEQEPVIYAYSFICTNLDCSTPARAAAVEHWYRHRTSIENIFRDSKHGAALRHLPSGHEQVNTAWMRASLIAAAIAAWCHQLTGVILGGELVEGHGVRGGKAMIATLRRRLIAMPARLVSHGGQLIMRLAPGPCLLPQVLAAIRALPAPPASPASRHHPAPPRRHRHAIPRTRPPKAPHQQKDPEPADPARHRVIIMPARPPGITSRSTTRLWITSGALLVESGLRTSRRQMLIRAALRTSFRKPSRDLVSGRGDGSWPARDGSAAVRSVVLASARLTSGCSSDWSAARTSGTSSHRPHRSRSLHPPVHNPGEATDMTARINRRTTVSGLINEYHRAA